MIAKCCCYRRTGQFSEKLTVITKHIEWPSLYIVFLTIYFCWLPMLGIFVYILSIFLLLFLNFLWQRFCLFLFAMLKVWIWMNLLMLNSLCHMYPHIQSEKVVSKNSNWKSWTCLATALMSCLKTNFAVFCSNILLILFLHLSLAFM